MLTDQIELANITMVNKIHLVDRESVVGVLRAGIHKLNFKAKIIDTTFGSVNPSDILHTRLLNFDNAQHSV